LQKTKDALLTRSQLVERTEKRLALKTMKCPECSGKGRWQIYSPRGVRFCHCLGSGLAKDNPIWLEDNGFHELAEQVRRRLVFKRDAIGNF
jgi:Zn ribbon nucleic-acid-binding protein